MTKMLNFSLKIKGVVGRVAHARSSDPATPPPKIWNVHLRTDLASSVRTSGLGLNILPYEKQTRLINSKYHINFTWNLY